MPPIGWGTQCQDWGERILLWRSRPAKERRGCPLTRQKIDPTMPLVVHGNFGVIRWSGGAGFWPNWAKTPCHRRGYWIQSPAAFGNGAYRYIGETMEDVQKYVDEYIHRAETQAAHLVETARASGATVMSRVVMFESENLAPRILDLLSEIKPSDASPA
ncbi:MAG: hypothetical protein AB7V39_04405 [Nitrospiraceae bacterium]